MARRKKKKTALPAQKKPFLMGQGLALLRVRGNAQDHLSGQQFHRERHAPPAPGKRRKRKKWRAFKRAAVVKHLMAGGKFRRLAVVCAGGLGKSTNLAWLEYALAGSSGRQVPFLFKLNEDITLADDGDDLLEQVLPGRIRKALGDGAPSREQLAALLKRYRAAGRITLLLDSIDQAGERGRAFARALLADTAWRKCPIVISSRSDGIYQHWGTLIGDKRAERDWHFLRIEPLAEPQRKQLLNQDGVDRYSRLPPAGQALMANPRHIEFLLECALRPARTGAVQAREPRRVKDYTLEDLRTAAHVFAGAVDRLVQRGMADARAHRVGCHGNERPPKPDASRLDYVHDLLGALAYAQYCSPAPARKPGPNVAQVESDGASMTAFKNRVCGLVKKHLAPFYLLQDFYSPDDLTWDLAALAAMNSCIEYDLIDSDIERSPLRWYLRPLQEFYVARWLSRYADDDAVKRLRDWRYNDMRDEEKKAFYEPLWGFLVEMPVAVRLDEPWARAVGVLFEHGATRSCELMYRASQELTRESPAGEAVLAHWRQEFTHLLHHGTPEQQQIAREMVDDDHLLVIPAGKCHYQADPPDNPGEEKYVEKFRLHKWPVTNRMYELFDPGHYANRWKNKYTKQDHPLTRKDGHGDDWCPVVNVSWFDAWCFAAWCGCCLPTELQREHAERAEALTGRVSRWFFGENESELEQYAHYSHGGSPRHTLPVNDNTRLPNPHGLYDMPGNVWEWCADWYDLQNASARVLRGGSWIYHGGYCRAADRGRFAPDYRLSRSGFRLAAVPCIVGAKSSIGGGAEAT